MQVQHYNPVTAPTPTQTATQVYIPPPVNYPGHANGHSSATHVPNLPAPRRPTLFEGLLQAIRRNLLLLLTWIIITIILIAFLVKRYGKTTWQYEGTIKHNPPYSYSATRLYTPPNIQSVLGIVKSPEVVNRFIEDQKLAMPTEAVQSKITVEVPKQGEFLAVKFDWPDQQQGAPLTNRLMELMIAHYDKDRIKSVETVWKGVVASTEKAKKDVTEAKRAREAFLREHSAENLEDKIRTLDTEIIRQETEISNLKTKLQSVKNMIADIDRRIEEARTNGEKGIINDPATDAETRLQLLIAQANQLREQMRDKVEIDRAKTKLPAVEERYRDTKKLYDRGFATRTEMDAVRADRDELKLIVEQGERWKKLADQRAELEKEIQNAKTPKNGNGTLVRQLTTQKTTLEVERDAMPSMIKDYEDRNLATRIQLRSLQRLKEQLVPMDDNIRQLEQTQAEQARVQTQHEFLNSPQAAELTITRFADVSTATSTNNTMKLALGIGAASAILFLCYLFLFDMPRHDRLYQGGANLGTPSLPHAPNLPSLSTPSLAIPDVSVPKVSLPNGSLPHVALPAGPTVALPSSPTMALPSTPNLSVSVPKVGIAPDRKELESISSQVVANVHHRPTLIMFTPVNTRINVDGLVADLAFKFAQRGDRVLVFDARDTQSVVIPTWGGPHAPLMEERTTAYLTGITDRSPACFTTTLVPSVDYSRANVNEHLSGVVGTYRFRRLVEAMRNQYSLILLITPDVSSGGGTDEHISTLSEGVVVVLSEDSNPSEVEAYIHSLRTSEG